MNPPEHECGGYMVFGVIVPASRKIRITVERWDKQAEAWQLCEIYTGPPARVNDWWRQQALEGYMKTKPPLRVQMDGVPGYITVS